MQRRQNRSRINTEAAPAGDDSVILDKAEFIRLLDEATATGGLVSLRKRVAAVKQMACSINGNHEQAFSADLNGNALCLRRDVLISELDQILEARTIERAKYYLHRLRRGVEQSRTSAINDINLLRWKEHEEVITDSLWILPRRDTVGAHLGWYWGNFVPQIPRQLMLRYTKKRDWVLDAFAGSGTTLIECRRLGRNGIGVELSRQVARKAIGLISQESNPDQVTTEIVTGDSRTIDITAALDRSRVKQVQLLIMHPPYHDIISFSKDRKDLSAASTTEGFLNMFGEVVDNCAPVLERGRYFALVIGDKYAKGEWVPLGFECMNEVLKRGFSLKSIVVKNFEETRAKRDQKQLWRYRALAGGFYIFKHEYIFLFKKK